MFIAKPIAFTDADDADVSGYTFSLDEPVSGQNAGTLFTLHDTPSGGLRERYAAAVVSGPAGRVKLLVALDGGSAADLVAASTVAVGGTPGTSRTLTVRGAAVPFGGATDSGQVVLRMARESSGAADWAG